MAFRFALFRTYLPNT